MTRHKESGIMHYLKNCLSEVMPDVKTLFEYEIEKLSSRNNLDYKELDIKSEYRLNTSWAAKLFIEVSTTDKTQSPKRETKITHDLKKTRQRFFLPPPNVSHQKRILSKSPYDELK